MLHNDEFCVELLLSESIVLRILVLLVNLILVPFRHWLGSKEALEKVEKVT